jgi:hypothetical protein
VQKWEFRSEECPGCVGVCWQLNGRTVEVNQVIAVSLINGFLDGIRININKVIQM